jgi:pimeloyl-ACP methyl ester carboxylesterase
LCVSPSNRGSAIAAKFAATFGTERVKRQGSSDTHKPLRLVRSVIFIAPAGTLAVKLPMGTRLLLRLPLLRHVVALCATSSRFLAAPTEWETPEARNHFAHFTSTQRARAEPALARSLVNTLRHFPLSSRRGEACYAAVGRQRNMIPTLVLWGAKDKTTPVAGAARLAALMPHAQFKVYDTGKHELPIERYDDVARDMLTWWSGLDKENGAGDAGSGACTGRSSTGAKRAV